MMVITPTKFFLAKGAAEGYSELNAFDNALLRAGVGNTNLIKISSIIPPECNEIEPMKLPYGAMIPVAYGACTSTKPGEIISAGIAVALPEGNDLPGVIMEHSSNLPLKDVLEEVEKMAEQALIMRDYKIKSIRSMGVEHTVENKGCAFACAVLWY